MRTEFPADRPAAPAWLTVPLARLYGLGVEWHTRRYPPERAFRPPVPVISVGNIAAGGSGKTPCVIALAKLLRSLEPDLAILSRGYGRAAKELVVVEPGTDWRQCGDEPLLIKQAVPEAAVVVHAERAVAARHAVDRLAARLLLLDDGFQHRRIARDLDLVLLDGQQPLGNGHLLPAGPLREPPDALGRATWLIGVGEDVTAAASLASRLRKPFLHAVPQLRLPAEVESPVFLLTGIARPSRLERMLTDIGIQIVGHRAFPDHHPFSERDLSAVAEAAVRAGARCVVTTAKDRVRIRLWPGPLRLEVAGLEQAFTPPGEMELRLSEWLLSMQQRA